MIETEVYFSVFLFKGMSAAIIRLKRKASYEPIDGLVVALKKSKYDEFTNSNEVYFKFAATLKNQKESIKDHIQAVLSKENDSKFSKWRDPRCTAVSQRNVYHICEKLKKELKAASAKKRSDLLNNRRLIFAETVPIDEDEENESSTQSAEVRKLFQLYDIIEENEEPKKQADGTGSIITCNNEPLVREKITDYVYDVYIADGEMDDRFVENTISLRPCSLTTDDIYSDDSEDNSEVYEDEDDSNDENNWRNEYPEDEESHSERASGDESDTYNRDIYYDEIGHSFSQTKLENDEYSSDDDHFDYSKILDPLQDDFGGSE